MPVNVLKENRTLKLIVDVEFNYAPTDHSGLYVFQYTKTIRAINGFEAKKGQNLQDHAEGFVRESSLTSLFDKAGDSGWEKNIFAVSKKYRQVLQQVGFGDSSLDRLVSTRPFKDLTERPDDFEILKIDWSCSTVFDMHGTPLPGSKQ